MNFDPIQEKEIKKTMELLVKDMRSLYQIYPYENIEVGISMIVGDYGDFWNLVITGESIKLYSNKHDNVTHLERKGKHKLIYTAGELEAHYKFIMQYDGIHNRIENIVRSRAKNSSLSIAKMKEYQQKYSKEATIEIEVPETINQHTLEVTEENGQKIGKLNFNGLTLKIIASDSVKIVNKSGTKQKRK